MVKGQWLAMNHPFSEGVVRCGVCKDKGHAPIHRRLA